VQLRRIVVHLCLCVTAGTPVACKTAVEPEIQFPDAPPVISTLDDFEAGVNRLVLLGEGDASRTKLREQLLAFLAQYMDEKLAAGDPAEALSALKYAVSLYTPQELRTADPHPELALRARNLYRVNGRHGHEPPAMLALAVEQRFGPQAERDRVLQEWAMLERWMVENGPYATEPLLRHEELEDALEGVAAVFPSPFVTKRLADLYVARYEEARRARLQGRTTDTAALRRMEITGYLLMRVYLRADDFEGAAAATQRVELDPPVAKLRAMMIDAASPRRSPLSLLALAEQFAPEPDADPSQPFVIQGFGIVDAISRRAVHRFPNEAYVHLLRARSLQSAGLLDASVVELRRTLELKEDIFAAWQTIAELEQQKLDRLAEDDPEAAEHHLAHVEALHERAIALWADRPIQPGLPQAFFTVAQGLYHAGAVDRAQALLERSLGIEPVPSAIDLLGTIALKRSELAQARKRYENLANLAYDDELAQLQWEARARFQLGEIASREGKSADSARHMRLALRHTNDLLARSGASASTRANRYVDRGTLLFLLGDTELAMDDFRRAAEIDPSGVKVYTEPLKVAVAHGYHEEAHSIFRRSMAQSEVPSGLKLYFCLWMLELSQRQSLPPDPEAERFVAEYSGTRWGMLLARHAQGKVAFEELVAQAQGPGQRAEAYFYEGLRRWDAGDRQAGKDLFRQVLETEMMGFLEYEMAQAYLEWNDVPRTARPPIAAAKQSASAVE